MNRRIFVKSAAALVGYPFICKSTELAPLVAGYGKEYLKCNTLQMMETAGYPYNVPESKQNVLYNLPPGVESYVIIADLDTTLQAYLIYPNRIELIHVLGNEKQGDGSYKSATKLFAAEYGNAPQKVQAINFPSYHNLEELINILVGLKDADPK